MPHFGIPHTDDDPNAPAPRRPSNAARRVRGANPVARPQLPASPANRVLSQEPRRSRNIARAAGNPNNPITQAFKPIDRFFGNTPEQRASGESSPFSNAISEAPGAIGDFLSRRPGLGGTGRDIVHGQGRRPGDFRAGNQNNPITQSFGGIDRAAQSAFPDLRNPPRGTPGTDEPDFFGEAPEGLPGRGLGRALAKGITTPSQFARDVGSGFRRIGRDVAQATSGLTGLFTADTGQDLADSFRGPNNPRPGTADDGLTPQQRLDLTFRGQGEPADITSEINDLPVRERANRLEEHGLDVERLGQDPTTVIRGTNVSQTRGGQEGGGNFPEAVFDEGFEVPAGTTDAELRDPERLKVLQARNSLSQSLRQVPAPGEAGIPAAVQAKMLADFDQQASAERGATTRGRERNASLERRTAFANAVTSRLGLGGSRGSGAKNRFDVVGIPFGEGASGNLGQEAFLIDKLGGTAPQRIPINRSRRERDTQDNRKQLATDLRDVNPGITDAEITAIFREWVDTGEFPPGIDFNSANSGGFGGFF